MNTVAHATNGRDLAAPSILIVDDDIDVRETLVDLLRWEGYRVASVPNGLEALEYVRRGDDPPALIVLDLMMPVMNGWQFLVERSADPSLAAIPVVVVSADGHARRNQRSIDATEFLEKPIHLDTLLDTVQRYC